MAEKAIITLLTDFGTADYFVAAMKGVILTAHPGATLVDISHEIPPHDVATAAFTLLACYGEFPAGTIHLAVVDPGVGSARRPIAISAGGYTFVGPDNGLFSHILDREPDARVFHLSNRSHFRSAVSTTFHGRDIFAPVAAAVADGLAISALGEEVTDPVRLELPARCDPATEGVLNAVILHVDRFGNCVTNLTRDALPANAAGALLIEVRGHTVTRLHSCYADAGSTPDEVFAIWGSAGFLELSTFCDSAARRLGATRGDSVQVRVLRM
jgi:S-adenosyl-L-methionine hydrolase (adenosine-forming)